MFTFLDVQSTVLFLSFTFSFLTRFILTVRFLSPLLVRPQNKGSLQFEDKWDLMRPIVLKLLRQEAVTKQQWFDLFS